MDTWIAAAISPGLFPHERIAKVEVGQTEPMSVFIHESFVDDENSLIRIAVLDRNETHALVGLATQGGSVAAVVPLSALQERG